MQRGFSLVELSIVLVILGLLTGGILAGQSLIRAAELRAVSTEYQRYLTAVSSFRDKYFAVPGDMPNATKFWGTSANCPGAYNQGTTDGTTCDGNNDGRVYFIGPNTSPTANETFRFWQHLASAGLIEGQYNGVSAATANNYYLAAGPDNTPFSKLNNARWNASYGNNVTGAWSSGLFHYEYSPFVFILGGASPPNWNAGRILKPEEAWNIDTKLDDGRAGMGKVVANWSVCTDAADGSQTGANYALSATSVDCLLMLRP